MVEYSANTGSVHDYPGGQPRSSHRILRKGLYLSLLIRAPVPGRSSRPTSDVFGGSGLT
ncbi:hypothetical protein HMPREF0724_11093 [Prescottella equi ATCC 33707]|uniref:Uncharacterized protein n=1 Tax=Prescottella equi ATCC 33707 TaxID=525370 RepID=E9SXM8_RHOHA|nr:hypothetical protein HMPREF0724_11093 [Prescottella equi ATCC 33707]